MVFRPWGGKRKGAGRKPKGDKAGASHTARPPLPSGCPVHVTSKLCDDMPPLRRRKLWQKVLRQALLLNLAWRKGGARSQPFW